MLNLPAVFLFCLCRVCVAEQQAPHVASAATFDATFTISNSAAIIPQSARRFPLCIA
jgi:hypothetical protein